MAHYLSILRREEERRRLGEPVPLEARSWAHRFAGRASDFIAEIMGDEWYGPDWLAWRAFVKSVFGEPMDAEEFAVYRQCTALDRPLDKRQREVWVPVGRRGGKSRILALLGVHLAVCYDYLPFLAPGEMGSVVVLADTRDHAASIMNYVKAALFDHPKLATLVKRPLVESIELEDRVEIEVVTASIKAVRSRTTIAALCDEIAFWQPDETCANPDVEILNGLRPSMITIPNAVLLAASSRYARKGALWDAFRDFYGRVEGPFVWSADTETMHPSVDRAFIAAEYERDPVAASAEYGLEFRSDVASFVLREVVESCVLREIREVEPRSGITYRGFVDPSGGSADSMTLAIAHFAPIKGKAVLDLVREVRPPFSPESVAKEFADIVKLYKIYEVRGDHYAGEWPREQFRKNGIGYVTSEETKSEIYQAWLPLINSNRADLLDIPRLIAQACGLERRTSRAGRDSIDHAPGGHDDVVNAAAGALVYAASMPAVAKIPASVKAWASQPRAYG